MGVILRVAFFFFSGPGRRVSGLITVNGRPVDDADGLNLAAYLSREGYVLTRIAVECNGLVVPKAQYDRRCLQDGDVLEVVGFVGGG